MKSPQKLLATSMIIYGNILMIITVLYFVFHSKQWLQIPVGFQLVLELLWL